MPLSRAYSLYSLYSAVELYSSTASTLYSTLHPPSGADVRRATQARGLGGARPAVGTWRPS